jgi:two-component system, NarL family, sensor histidine kinase BarA
VRIRISQIVESMLRFLRLSPLSLAAKCRFTFGAAVLLSLIIALSIPYVWMGQLTKMNVFGKPQDRVESVLLHSHFRLRTPGELVLRELNADGTAKDPNDPGVRWIDLRGANRKALASLGGLRKEMVTDLLKDESRIDDLRFTETNSQLESHYVRVFRATEGCISCHNAEGPAAAFAPNEIVGVALLDTRGIGPDLHRTKLLNRLWIAVAGLIGGTGAMIAFYYITQRLILSPIRQLRALANNVAEGNLDIRSSITTRDEYERLAEAFNHMLDSLQAAQEKLRQANRQLDAKIVELSESNIELFKANKLKSEFLANMSHEFRTPLNAILGFAQVLREKPGLLKKEQGQRYAENIITSGNRLLSMINDLLALAKAQAGKLELHVEPVSLSELCESVLSSFSLLARKKRLRLSSQITPDIPILVTDGGKVLQVLYNFLSNAVKFTPPRGQVTLTAGMLDDKTVRIAVADTGCGIAEADQAKIFDKFRQVDGSITRESSGTGLGLAICKELAGLLAGSIGLKSEVNFGSTFWLDIPIQLRTDPAQAPTPAAPAGHPDQPRVTEVPAQPAPRPAEDSPLPESA